MLDSLDTFFITCIHNPWRNLFISKLRNAFVCVESKSHAISLKSNVIYYFFIQYSICTPECLLHHFCERKFSKMEPVFVICNFNSRFFLKTRESIKTQVASRKAIPVHQTRQYWFRTNFKYVANDWITVVVYQGH